MLLPGKTPNASRTDYLPWLIAGALILAVLPVFCVAQIIFWWLTPNNQPFKSISAARGWQAYEPFPANLRFAPLDDDLPNLVATEVAQRTQMPITQTMRSSPVSIVAVPPPPIRIDPPTPTVTPTP